MIWMMKDYVVTLLRHKGGATALEYALIMVLVVMFFIAGIHALGDAIGTLFDDMGGCLGADPLCGTGP